MARVNRKAKKILITGMILGAAAGILLTFLAANSKMHDKNDEIKTVKAKYEKVAKGVSQQMGGKVLNYEAKDILNRGRAEGRREGEEQTKIQIAKKLLALGNDIQSVADLAELPEETVEKLARSTNQSKR